MRKQPARRSGASLAARVQALEDERAILHLFYLYSHIADFGPAEAWADCFTKNGVLEIRSRTGQSSSHRGRTAITAFSASRAKAPEVYHLHLPLAPLITLNGDAATCLSYFASVEEGPNGEPYVRTFGRYHDTLVKEEAGLWRLKKRVIERLASNPNWQGGASARKG
ncbi:MAG: nuclear transport factor 2 family protein [Chloroflexi bacterium]|nr:nuclear transport factor 2 family protein [Chloroflexota bacterium]